MEKRTKISSKYKTGGFKTIIWAGLIAGVLDGTAASIVLKIKLDLNPGQVMQFVASGIYGRSAFSGGIPMVLIGILLHLVTSITIAAGYFYAFTIIKLIRNFPVSSGLALGLIAWIIMNLIVVPLSKTPPSHIGPGDATIGIIMHMILVGLPISFIVKNHFDRYV